MSTEFCRGSQSRGGSTASRGNPRRGARRGHKKRFVPDYRIGPEPIANSVVNQWERAEDMMLSQNEYRSKRNGSGHHQCGRNNDDRGCHSENPWEAQNTFGRFGYENDSGQTSSFESADFVPTSFNNSPVRHHNMYNARDDTTGSGYKNNRFGGQKPPVSRNSNGDRSPQSVNQWENHNAFGSSKEFQRGFGGSREPQNRFSGTREPQSGSTKSGQTRSFESTGFGPTSFNNNSVRHQNTYNSSENMNRVGYKNDSRERNAGFAVDHTERSFRRGGRANHFNSSRRRFVSESESDSEHDFGNIGTFEPPPFRGRSKRGRGQRGNSRQTENESEHKQKSAEPSGFGGFTFEEPCELQSRENLARFGFKGDSNARTAMGSGGFNVENPRIVSQNGRGRGNHVNKARENTLGFENQNISTRRFNAQADEGFGSQQSYGSFHNGRGRGQNSRGFGCKNDSSGFGNGAQASRGSYRFENGGNPSRGSFSNRRGNRFGENKRGYGNERFSYEDIQQTNTAGKRRGGMDNSRRGKCAVNGYDSGQSIVDDLQMSTGIEEDEYCVEEIALDDGSYFWFSPSPDVTSIAGTAEDQRSNASQNRCESELSTNNCQEQRLTAIEKKLWEETQRQAANIKKLEEQIQRMQAACVLPIDAGLSATAEKLEEEEKEEEEGRSSCSKVMPPIKPGESMTSTGDNAKAFLPPAKRANAVKVQVLANAFKLDFNPKQKVFGYSVDAAVNFAPGDDHIPPKDLIKGSRDDNVSTSRARILMEAMKLALNAYGIARREQVVYDGAGILFTNEDLAAKLKPHNSTLEVKLSDLSTEAKALLRFAGAESLSITIQETGQFLMDGQRAVTAQDSSNVSLKTFLEMLSNQDTTREWTKYRNGSMFPTCPTEKEKVRLGGGIYQLRGIQKGVRMVRGSEESVKTATKGKRGKMAGAASREQQPNVVITIDSKIGVFFEPQCMMTTFQQQMGFYSCDYRQGFNFGNKQVFNELNRFVKGLRLTFRQFDEVTGTHFQRSLMATGLTNQRLETLNSGQRFQVMLSDEDRECRRDLPGILFKTKMGTLVVPMELAMVAPNQRVPIHKTFTTDPSNCRMKIEDRFNQIGGIIRELKLDNGGVNNVFFKSFGVSINSHGYDVEAIRRPFPTLKIAGGKILYPDRSKATWSQGRSKYVKPAAFDLLLVLHTSYNAREETEIIKGSDAFKKMMQEKGLTWKETQIRAIRFRNNEQLKEVLKEDFEKMKGRQVANKMLSAIVLIDNEKSKSHSVLKLMERRHEVVSMQMTTRTARALPFKNMTCQNVVSKFNCKLGGLNYEVIPETYGKKHWVTSGELLIMGYDVCHPTGIQSRDERLNATPPDQPSIVGFSFNGGEHAESFIGDFHFQTPRREQVDDRVLNERVKWMLDSFVKYRERAPKEFIIVRDGVSEGQYVMVQREELGAIKEACAEWANMDDNKETYKLADNWCPKFVMLIVTKRHNLRFGELFNNKLENTKPSTVIDTDIVRNDSDEFYLQTHRVIQGSGKMPCYTIVENQLGMNKDELQALMSALSYEHQIVDLPISLPEPVYQADEWAKRGQDMYRAYCDIFTVPYLKDKGNYSTCPIDFDTMTKRLSYKTTKLIGNRVNA